MPLIAGSLGVIVTMALADALGLDKNRVRAGFVALILGWIAVIGAAITSGYGLW